MWSKKSGGNALFNTEDQITPNAFFKPSIGHDSIYDMTPQEFHHNVNTHLGNGAFIRTEFSSWSASPMFALRYAAGWRNNHAADNVHLSIVDTADLPNTALHVQSLKPVYDYCSRNFSFTWLHLEYLIHGVIKGSAYKAVRLQKLMDNGLYQHVPELSTTRFTGLSKIELMPLAGPAVIPNEATLRGMVRVAKLFGFRFHTAVVVALMCCVKRPQRWPLISNDHLGLIVRCLGNSNNIPHDWQNKAPLRVDLSKTDDGTQMARLLDALAPFWATISGQQHALENFDGLSQSLPSSEPPRKADPRSKELFIPGIQHHARPLRSPVVPSPYLKGSDEMQTSERSRLLSEWDRLSSHTHVVFFNIVFGESNEKERAKIRYYCDQKKLAIVSHDCQLVRPYQGQPLIQ